VVPHVSTVEELDRAAADFVLTDLGLVIEPPALAAARQSLEESGLLLLGEVHGVRENPLVIRALMQAFGLGGLALEWHEDLTPAVRAFLAGGRLADHPLLWSGDGRITAGHLAVLRERAAAGPLSLTLFDATMGADWTWSQHDEEMARRVLAAPATGTGTLVVAGNAHTPTARTGLGEPLGACLAGQRPGVREIRISYGGGRFYNIQPRRFRRRTGLRRRSARLHERGEGLVLDLPAAGEAVVPQRPMPWPAGSHLEQRLPGCRPSTGSCTGRQAPSGRDPNPATWRPPQMTSSRPDDIRDDKRAVPMTSSPDSYTDRAHPGTRQNCESRVDIDDDFGSAGGHLGRIP
jgi:hypothetical protein